MKLDQSHYAYRFKQSTRNKPRSENGGFQYRSVGIMSDRKTYRPGPSFSINKKDIEDADDYGDVFDIADQMGVDLGGLDELEDMKTRLLLFYKKAEGEPNYKDVVSKALVTLRAESKKKREKLTKLLTETKDKLGSVTVDHTGKKIQRRGSAVIKGFLKSEGTIQNLDVDIDNKLDALKFDTCTVVVSGETSAGKSSILNLLLGEEVVPTFFGSCTSVITRISYNKERRAKINYTNGKREKIRNIPKDEICKRLKPYLFVENESDRDRTTNIKEVIIQCPANILECGLILVDSPGIGENDAMDRVIVNFVAENQINGFLYIIKTDNGGGVDEDRLLGLLKVILEQEKLKAEKGLLPFDSQCAMFVCNFWDLIDENQQDTVFNHVYQRLVSIWPSMNKSLQSTFSAYKAKLNCDIDQDFIVDDYKNLLNNLKELYSKAMDKRVKSTYKWLENLLKRSVHHLKTIVHRIDGSEKDLETKMRSVWEKLNTLKLRSEIVINGLRKEIEEETDTICEEFREYLKEPRTRMAITMWIDSELPEVESGKWEYVKESLESRTLMRISNELDNWEKDKGKITAVKNNVEKSIVIQLNILQEELNNIEDDMQSDTASVASNESFESKAGQRRFSVPFCSIPTSVGKQTLPVKLMNRVFAPFGKHGKRAVAAIGDAIGRKKLNAYKQDPITYAKRRSDKVLDRFVKCDKEDILWNVISEFMNEPREFLSDIENRIPAMVKTNQDNMDHIGKCRQQGDTHREMYEQMMEGMEKLKRVVTDYGDGFIFVNDFGADDIQIVSDDETEIPEENRRSRVFDVSTMLESMESSVKQRTTKAIQRGLWSAQQIGILKANDGHDRPVTIRIYLQTARIVNTDSEVAKLRLLKNENVGELLGIQNSSHTTPAFVFDGRLKPLKSYLSNRLLFFKDEIPRILGELLLGLEYIHRKKMVHMELNQNTITVNDSGTVKLCGACQPKPAAFPDDLTAVLAGDFVYLSPEVLQGESYIAVADIYAFGLLVFEIFVCQMAFHEQRDWPLLKFSSECHPNGMNGCPYSIQALLPDTQEVIQDCLNVVLDKRPSIEQLLHSLTEIKNDPQLERINTLRTRRISDTHSCFEVKRFQDSHTNGANNIQSDLPVSKQKTKDLFDHSKTPHIGKIPKHKTQFSTSQVDKMDHEESSLKTTRVQETPKINILRASSEGSQSLEEEATVQKTPLRLTRSLEGQTSRSPALKGNMLYKLAESLDIKEDEDTDYPSDRQSPSKLRQS